MSREGIDLRDFAVPVPLKLSDAGTEDGGADQRADAAHHVNAGGTREVVEAHLRQPAAAPDPMRLNGIDHSGDDRGIDAVRKKFGSLRHCARDDRGRGGAKDQIEDEAGPVEVGIVGEDIQSGLSDEADHILAQQKACTDHDEKDCSDAEVHQVLHQDIARVFGAGESGFHHGEARLHPEDQSGPDQKPAAEQQPVDLTEHFF